MLSDIRRLRTFLAYKGFQWEPLSEDPSPDDNCTDFIALKDGKAVFIGTLLSIGMERDCGDLPIQAVVDAEDTSRFQARLMRQLTPCARHLDGSATRSELPIVAALVNHEPHRSFEDLTLMVEGHAAEALPLFDLFIWFDDFRSDRMLFRSASSAHHQLFEWFHVV